MLLTFKTISIELREIDCIQKQEIIIKVFRVQASRNAITQKKNKKKSNKTKKNVIVIVVT
jgi:hypothetical protein